MPSKILWVLTSKREWYGQPLLPVHHRPPARLRRLVGKKQLRGIAEWPDHIPLTFQILLSGKPVAVHIAAVIAAPEGVAYLQEHLPDDCHLWIAALDVRLDARSYIVPGLGDAGDLVFGDKR